MEKIAVLFIAGTFYPEEGQNFPMRFREDNFLESIVVSLFAEDLIAFTGDLPVPAMLFFCD